ncbi:hypothetical protein CBR_g55398 [Chara braunii]|uniref:glycerophosphodiester phosphodiesterase n=1 Tax=Chara braunii TaxID=69332 RepID=A0A388K7L6_CHABU|nr:hypothetical protein CBR_g55398 [Chara braunii]|eukprot:GBG66055.1 hypothetical protein CBR_g55398 [Chara braunii]
MAAVADRVMHCAHACGSARRAGGLLAEVRLSLRQASGHSQSLTLVSARGTTRGVMERKEVKTTEMAARLQSKDEAKAKAAAGGMQTPGAIASRSFSARPPPPSSPSPSPSLTLPPSLPSPPSAAVSPTSSTPRAPPPPPPPPHSPPAAASHFRQLWDELTSREGVRRMLVVGHRGSGQNKTKNVVRKQVQEQREGDQVHSFDQVRPSIRENTLLSFNSAVRHGADFVEFDVQVLADGVPIIFHDDWIITRENGAKRICQLTTQDFRGIGPQMPHTARRGKAGEKLVRRSSFDPSTLIPWACDVEDSLCTLAEALDAVPFSCGFNVEMKFDEVANVAVEELTRSIDAVMHVIRENGRGRRIFFSTFHPDAAVLLKKKVQGTFPVFFLTDGGRPHVHSDPRRNSVDEAINHCLRHGLDGVVADVAAILALDDKRVGARARENGLLLFTYGELNNEAEVIYFQHHYGVDGVIVDHVLEMAFAVRQCAWQEMLPPFQIGKVRLGGGGGGGGGDYPSSLVGATAPNKVPAG